MASKVVVFGTGSFAQCAHFYFTRDSEHEVAAFTVHEKHLKEKEFLGLPVLPFERVEKDFPASVFKMFIAVGYKNLNKLRADIFNEAKRKSYELVTYLSSKCTHWGDTKIGENCFIFEDNTIQPFVTIGNDVILWSGNHVGHHASIGDHCFITSQVVISGHVRVGSYSFLGVNATIRDNIRIGEACVIGAGALILNSTKDKEVYAAERTKPHGLKSDEIKI
jgi:sugar O-acyltransferase (sialic acid O-acetyltransferase NeuD family)